MGQLSELYLVSGNVKLAKDLLVKMEELAKEVFGDDSFERGRTLCALAGCYGREEGMEITTLPSKIICRHLTYLISSICLSLYEHIYMQIVLMYIYTGMCMYIQYIQTIIKKLFSNKNNR